MFERLLLFFGLLLIFDQNLVIFGENSQNETDSYAPSQVHLSLGASPSTYIVTWLTYKKPEISTVQWENGQQVLGNSKAEIVEFFESGFMRYIHRAQIDGIVPGQNYTYKVGSPDHLSREFWFVGITPRPDRGYKYAVFGDLGLIEPRIFPELKKQTEAGEYDLIIHNGDFAYDMHEMNGTKGDDFMKMMEPLTSRLPYMTTPGNHESNNNFSQYANRFSMPGKTSNQWYSFDLGDAHFIMFSTEVYFYYLQQSPQLMIDQYKWLEEDLKKANENRKNVPWIVTFGHRGMYCSTEVAAYGPDDCHSNNSIIRKGVLGLHSLGLEDLFYKNGVDLNIWGHEHSYTRMWPVYDGVVYNGTEEPYTDPNAPVHMISGAAGCAESPGGFGEAKPFDAFRSNNYSYSIMQIHNQTHLHWQQYRVNDTTIEDEIWLIKNKHEPYVPVNL